jgi:hypothetical protein
MLKIVWSYQDDPHAVRTLIGDYHSIWETWYHLEQNPKLLVKMFDLKGTEIDASKGLAFAATYGQTFVSRY